MSLQLITVDDWLNRIFRKSKSDNSKFSAKTSLKSFEIFCKHSGTTFEGMMLRFKQLVKENDFESIYSILDKWVQFLDEDHPEIIIEKHEHIKESFKKKSPKTIKTYFAFLKSYLRICQRIKLDQDDIKDYVQFPKEIREPRQPLKLETVRQIIDDVRPKRKALYLVLLSSGMRVSEALSLTKKNLHMDEDPVRITLFAGQTKTKQGRETYISSEAAAKLRKIIKNLDEDDLIFSKSRNQRRALIAEENSFTNVRKRLGFIEKYPNSDRYLVNIHAFRSYFHTKASQKHGTEYANALDGHSGYLEQYYRLSLEERAKMYKELEPDLLVDYIKVEPEKTKDMTIKNMQLEMQKMQDQIKRLEFLKKN